MHSRTGRPFSPGPSRLGLAGRRIAFLLEASLWISGAAALAYCAFFFGSGAYEQARGERELARRLSLAQTGALPSEGGLVGRIQVPRLDLSAVIFEGTTEPVLRKGVGHFIGSALPAAPGNVVLAAHRDTFFRALQNVKKGDEIVLQDLSGRFRYRVRSMTVVPPDAVEVLRPTPAPTLTLITCYPFAFLGHAPERFVVRAEQIATATRNASLPN